jgi:hypothetical protein
MTYVNNRQVGPLPKFDSSNKQPGSIPQQASEQRILKHDLLMQLHTHSIADNTQGTTRCTPKHPDDYTQPVNQHSPLILYRHCHRP